MTAQETISAVTDDGLIPAARKKKTAGHNINLEMANLYAEFSSIFSPSNIHKHLHPKFSPLFLKHITRSVKQRGEK